jgi:hypothetical protein
MKKIMNYSLLMVLFSLISFSCAKTEMDDLTVDNKHENAVFGGTGGYTIVNFIQTGSLVSFDISASTRHGLSNIQLELLECPTENPVTVILGPGGVEFLNANFTSNELTFPLIPIYNLDGSCVGTKGSDFTSFVKFEFDQPVSYNGVTYKLDEYIKKFGGTISFSLSNTTITLAKLNIIIKTGGKDGKCFRDFILNKNGCTPPPPPLSCSFSQGRFFNGGNDGKHWPTDVNYVTVGSVTIAKNQYTLPATSVQMRAYFQAATLILSGTDMTTVPPVVPPNVIAAFNYIVVYFTTHGLLDTPTSIEKTMLQNAAGTIGDWISTTGHC